MASSDPEAALSNHREWGGMTVERLVRPPAAPLEGVPAVGEERTPGGSSLGLDLFELVQEVLRGVAGVVLDLPVIDRPLVVEVRVDR